MTRKPYEQGRTFIGRLPNGADIVAAVTKIANEEGIKGGTVEVHGTVSRAVVTIFNATTRMAETVEREGGMEIAAMSGTISQFKGRSMGRLNGIFAAPDGSLVGGSVGVGTIAYAAEVVITELLGGTLTRDFDMETGLPLWKESSLLIE